MINNSPNVDETEKLEILVTKLLVSIEKVKCTAIICDDNYCDIFTKSLFLKVGVSSTFFMVSYFL